MANVTVDALADLRNDRILKITQGAVIVGDYDVAPLLSKSDLFNVDGSINALPTAADGSQAYYSAGLQDTSGIAFNRAISVDEVTSWQSPEVQRTDVSADKISVQAKFQEINLVTLAMNEGRKISEVAAAYTPGQGSMELVKNPSGLQPLRRLMLLGSDETRGIVVARVLPRSQVTAVGGQSWQRSTEVQTDITFEAFREPAWGTSYKYWIGGSGLDDLMAEATTSSTTVSPWAANTAYPTGSLVSAGGQTFQAASGGTSGTTAPNASNVGGTATDGSVTWTRTA